MYVTPRVPISHVDKELKSVQRTYTQLHDLQSQAQFVCKAGSTYRKSLKKKILTECLNKLQWRVHLQSNAFRVGSARTICFLVTYKEYL